MIPSCLEEGPTHQPLYQYNYKDFDDITKVQKTATKLL